MHSCPLCDYEARIEGLGPLNSYYDISCATCGSYKISDQAKEELTDSTRTKDKPKISAFVTKRNLNGSNITILAEQVTDMEKIPYAPFLTIDQIIDQYPILMTERINQALINLTLKSEYPGFSIVLSNRTYPLLLSSTTETKEILFILRGLAEKGYISSNVSTLPTSIVVSAKGWDRVNELSYGRFGESRQGFIAMSFDQSMNSASETIKEVIKKTGYEPMRIDNKQHNNRIDSEIIAEIRRSRFVVADVTQHRNGVYYEAGFAQGLGIPVIWTCSKEDFDKLHFDTRQINHIIWDNEEMLYNELFNRIRATIT
ncbi:hypothetical protein RZN22_13415 [Bacillaceae bacterium S4-13-58]